MSARAGRKEAWQGAEGVKKYKSGTGKGQNFSWNEPTEGNGALKIKLKYFHYKVY